MGKFSNVQSFPPKSITFCDKALAANNSAISTVETAILNAERNHIVKRRGGRRCHLIGSTARPAKPASCTRTMAHGGHDVKMTRSNLGHM